MAGLLLEIVLEPSTLYDAGIDDRRVVGHALDEALAASDLGEVAGGFEGAGVCTLEVELDEGNRSSEAVILIRRVLRGLGLRQQAAVFACEDAPQLGRRARWPLPLPNDPAPAGRWIGDPDLASAPPYAYSRAAS